ncbi:HAD family hydrolase [Jejuia pallidilutea]|uniref:2-haloacid dehalogenase n=1 Tax=Jejuia pallidilutea TaxID=504487 RepID=A0A090W5H5_9FLAO|nr:HAD family phosphatase [Jejuia pallidilutea]PQV50188.1 2-haloacid dehalogenase [Jejuia pallidilutea]GAL70704.1 hydrolase haloacid dehalogenase-like family [Jejuia pallidilutea]GAL90580.1 hydrolase [Jejuia pallidilutea]
MTKIEAIIFDLGGVLIDWNPEYVFLDAFNGDREKMQWFLNNICTMNWNENQDAGYPLVKATNDLVKQFPEYENYIKMYYGNWEQMLGGAIEGSVKILKHLIDNRAYKVVALTNWSSETFPIAKKQFDFLKWFEGIVVSGEEKTRKPYKEIFNITLNRFKIKPETSIFIDDNLKNIQTANSLNINTIHFKNPKQLASELKNYNIYL